MIRISSIVQNGGRDDDRLSGFTKDPLAAFFIGGMAVTQLTPDATGAGKTMTYFDSTAVLSATNVRPLGLVIESTTGFPGIAANNDQGAGIGFDTQDYAKGGLYSAFHRPGNLVDAFDDLRDRTQVTINGAPQNKSCPFVANRVWAIGDTVYATATAIGQKGLLDNTGGISGSASLGTIRAVTNAGLGTPMLTIELNIVEIP